MSPERQRIVIGELCGWRRWQFGDKWVKGLKLADNQFNGYIRRLIKDSPSDSKYVYLDIDENSQHPTISVINRYTPKSHWVYSDGRVSRYLPDYLNDLNECHKFEQTLTDDEYTYVYENCLSKITYNLSMGHYRGEKHRRYIQCATAEKRCEAFLKTKEKWED